MHPARTIQYNEFAAAFADEDEFAETNDFDFLSEELLTPTPLIESNSSPAIMTIGKPPPEERSKTTVTTTARKGVKRATACRPGVRVSIYRRLLKNQIQFGMPAFDAIKDLPDDTLVWGTVQKSSSKGVYVVKIDRLPLDSNLVKLPRAHLKTVPKGSEEPEYLHAEDPAVIAEECSEHPIAAAAPSNDVNPFNDGDNYDEDWDDQAGVVNNRKRSNRCYLNNASSISSTCHQIYRRQQNRSNTSMEKRGRRMLPGQFLPTTKRLLRTQCNTRIIPTVRLK